MDVIADAAHASSKALVRIEGITKSKRASEQTAPGFPDRAALARHQSAERQPPP